MFDIQYCASLGLCQRNWNRFSTAVVMCMAYTEHGISWCADRVYSRFFKWKEHLSAILLKPKKSLDLLTRRINRDFMTILSVFSVASDLGLFYARMTPNILWYGGIRGKERDWAVLWLSVFSFQFSKLQHIPFICWYYSQAEFQKYFFLLVDHYRSKLCRGALDQQSPNQYVRCGSKEGSSAATRHVVCT